MDKRLKSILIADGEASVRRETADVLRASGFQVLTAADESKAWQLLTRELVDMVIAGVLLPQTDGYRFCEKIKQTPELTHIRVLFFNESFLGPSERELARSVGVSGFVDKPVSTQSGLAIIKAQFEGTNQNAEIGFQPSGYESLYRLSLTSLIDTLRNTASKTEGRTNDRMGAVDDLPDEQASATKLKRLATAVECAAESILITDGEGIIEYVNPAFEKITGYSSDEIIGEKPSVLKSGHHDTQFYQQMWTTIKGGQPWRGNLINKRKDGSYYHLEATISPITDATGTITNFVAVRRDISHEKEMEQQLRQSQKLEAIGTLAGGIAHDFNNILSAVFGYCELSLVLLEKDSIVYRHIQEILRASERARDLVRQILTFSRHQEQDYQPIQVETLLKEAVKFIRASLPATIAIREAINCDPIVMGDPTQIHQVIINLLTNAGQAMHATGGRLDVRLDRVEIDSGFVDRSVLAPGDYLQMTVRDTGPGMSAQVLQRIFDPFFTTREVNKGTGLGLSVVHGIVKRHGGAIHAFSRPGAGAAFKVFLPVVKASPQSLQNTLRSIPTGNETILFVDDEAMIVDSARRILESLGYRVTTTTSSEEALSFVRKDPSRFDLVITDMTMPQLTGEALSAKILELRNDMPIILCTGFSAKTDEAKALAKGLRAFIYKPILRRDLAETIRRVLDG